MLDQNTDRMWFVIGAVIVGAAIIFIANGTLPDVFASVTETFKASSESAMHVVDSIGEEPNLLRGGDTRVSNSYYHMRTYPLIDKSLKQGEKVTVSIKGTLNPNKHAFGLYNTTGHGESRLVIFTHADFNEDGVAQKTFNWKLPYTNGSPIENDEIILVSLYSLKDGGVDNVENTIEWVRLERYTE